MSKKRNKKRTLQKPKRSRILPKMDKDLLTMKPLKERGSNEDHSRPSPFA